MCPSFCNRAVPNSGNARPQRRLVVSAKTIAHSCWLILRRLLKEDFGFGDFVFRLPDHTEVGRAGDLGGLETMALQEVPAESVAYHAQSNHFSHWLMARTEFALAQKLRPRKVSDFASTEHLRQRPDRVDRRLSQRAK